MNARSNRTRRTGNCFSTRLLIVVMAAALLLSFAPMLGGGNVAAEETNPRPVRPGQGQTNNMTLVQPTGTAEPDGPGSFTAIPLVTPVVIDDFVAETPEPDDEIDDFTIVTPIPTEEIDDFVAEEPDDLEVLDVSLSGHAFECTPGVLIEALPTDQLAANCANPLEVTFTITTSGGSSDHVGTDVLVNDQSILGSTSIFAQPHDGYAYNFVRAVCNDSAGAEVYNDGAALGGPWFEFVNNMHIDCDFFIAPQTGGTIELVKYLCPEDFVAAQWFEYQAACTETMNGVEFYAGLNDTGIGTKFTGDDGDGTILWDVEGSGGLLIQETIPAGFLEPVIFCGFSYTFQTDGGLAIADGLILPDAAPGGTIMHDFQDGETLFCEVFNRPSTEDGSITVVKHTCAPGYDVNAPGANPWLDCPELTDGVVFNLTSASVDLVATTGDAGNGTAYFGDLAPDTYALAESVPDGTWYSFAYECIQDDGLAPTTLIELHENYYMYVEVPAGVDVTCHFMNVPELHGGTVILTKYWCDGDVYSVWVCDIYEFGATFSFDGGYGPIQVTTAADGTAVLFLDPGAYELDEVTMTWCFAEASNVDWQGNIVVEDGETTYVNVFNCGDRPHKTPDHPGKFPNTGVRPEA